jgi:hypothetical protein
MGEVSDILLCERKNSIILFEGSQAKLASPSDRESVRVKTSR